MSWKFRHRASYAANIVLALAAAMLALQSSAPVVRAPKVAAPPPAESALPEALELPRYVADAPAAERRKWLVDELRAMGMPNRTLARVVLADLDASWNKYAAEVTKKNHGDPEIMAELQLKIDLGRDEEMRKALGEEGFKAWDRENMLRETNRGGISLTPSETEAAYALWKKLQNRDLELKQAKQKAEIDEAGVSDEYAKALTEFDRQMKALLGDERYASARQADEGAAAADLKRELAKASPSDAQFRDLLKTQQAWNDLRAKLDRQFQNDQSSAAYADQIRALDEARDQEYQRVLGAAAFDTLQKEQHPSYALMEKYAGAWGLDQNKIDSVYGTIKYYEKTVADYQDQVRALEAQSQRVDHEEADRDLRQFADQTQQSLRLYLGQESFDKLKRNGVFQFYPNQSPHGASLSPADHVGGG
jgi:hypothetical protein